MLFDEAFMGGASRYQAALIIDVNELTLKSGAVVEDQRPQSVQGRQLHQLTHKEEQAILNTCHRPEYQSFPPSEILPLLADKGVYLASESSLYRVLKNITSRAPSRPYEITPSSARADQFYGNRAKPGPELGH